MISWPLFLMIWMASSTARLQPGVASKTPSKSYLKGRQSSKLLNEMPTMPKAGGFAHHPILSLAPDLVLSSCHGRGTKRASFKMVEIEFLETISLRQASMPLADLAMNPRVLYRPTTPMSPPSDPCPAMGIRPAVGFRLVRPENMAGILTLPPKSDPEISQKLFASS